MGGRGDARCVLFPAYAIKIRKGNGRSSTRLAEEKKRHFAFQFSFPTEGTNCCEDVNSQLIDVGRGGVKRSEAEMKISIYVWRKRTKKKIIYGYYIYIIYWKREKQKKKKIIGGSRVKFDFRWYHLYPLKNDFLFLFLRTRLCNKIEKQNVQ